MTVPEYILHRKNQSEIFKLISRIRFPESRSTLEIAEEFLSKDNLALLEVGCGPGVISMYLHYRVKPKFSIGIDTDKEAIRQGQTAAKYLNIKNIDFIVASATDLPFRNGQFNFVLCQEVIEHVPTPKDVLDESHRVLANQGNLLITTPTSHLAPFSSDWFETKIHNRPIMDEFAGHLFRFDSEIFQDQIRQAGLTIIETKFTNQYIGSFLLFVSVLWKRKNLRKGKKPAPQACEKSATGFLNLVFMAGQTLDIRLLGHFFGSNIVVLANLASKKVDCCQFVNG
jgi:ubiquinone/menaquinone biosynthesis C-methylase UbiE